MEQRQEQKERSQMLRKILNNIYHLLWSKEIEIEHILGFPVNSCHL